MRPILGTIVLGALLFGGAWWQRRAWRVERKARARALLLVEIEREMAAIAEVVATMSGALREFGIAAAQAGEALNRVALAMLEPPDQQEVAFAEDPPDLDAEIRAILDEYPPASEEAS